MRSCTLLRLFRRRSFIRCRPGGRRSARRLLLRWWGLRSAVGSGLTLRRRLLRHREHWLRRLRSRGRHPPRRLRLRLAVRSRLGSLLLLLRRLLARRGLTRGGRGLMPMRRGLMLVLLVSPLRLLRLALALPRVVLGTLSGRLIGPRARRRPPRCPLGRPRLMPTARRVWWIPCRSLPQLLWGLPGRPLALPGLPLVVRRRPPCRLVRLRIVLLWPRSGRGPLKLLPRRLPVVPSRRGSLLAVRSLALLGLLRVSRRRRLLLRLLGVARRRRALMPTARSPWWIPYRGMMTVSLWRARPPPRC